MSCNYYRKIGCTRLRSLAWLVNGAPAPNVILQHCRLPSSFPFTHASVVHKQWTICSAVWPPLLPRQVPFTLSCPMPGRFRWVTTTIARFDPEVQWPSDLSCTFKWNSALITYDGGAHRHLRAPMPAFPKAPWTRSYTPSHTPTSSHHTLRTPCFTRPPLKPGTSA